jgi:hypothetical protein
VIIDPAPQAVAVAALTRGRTADIFPVAEGPIVAKIVLGEIIAEVIKPANVFRTTKTVLAISIRLAFLSVQRACKRPDRSKNGQSPR